MRASRNKVKSNEIGVGDIIAISDNTWEKGYYYITVGNMNVVIPEQLNIDTLEGIKLIKERASMLTDQGLAFRIAEEVGGKVFRLQERYERLSVEVQGGWDTGVMDGLTMTFGGGL